jgi:outer membrane protein TolC
MVKSGVAAVALCSPFILWAQERQTLSLSEAFSLAEQQYPLTRQMGLLRETENLTLENLNSGYLPQVTLNGQATYQSDVTRVSIPLPGIKIPEQPKDQYRAVTDVSQLLFDGGLIRNQKDIQRLTTVVEEHKLGVELHSLKARISQLYFSILYQDELLKQTTLAARDVQIGIDKVRPQVENGVVLRSNLLLLQAQRLQMEQRVIEIKAARKGLIDALAQFLKQPLTEAVQLEVPVALPPVDTSITRPEVRLFQSQSLLLAGQEKLIGSRNTPKASAFVQGGYGRPGLNMLSDEFRSYYIGGLRLTWPLGGLYTVKRDKKLTDISRQTVDLQKETFLLNTRAQLQQQKTEIDRYAALAASDEQIISLRRQITEAAQVQLENAVITANDYLLQVNAEDAARRSLILHRLQLLQAQTNYAITAGKL